SKVESADPQYPLGFTPDVVEENDVENSSGKFSKPNTTDKVMCYHGFKFQASGSILEVMDELIKVGKTMGYNMDACVKNIEAILGWIQELNTKHGVKFVALQKTKMDRMDRFSIKALENATVFDSFLAVTDQNEDPERKFSYDDIKRAVWDCRTNISHGPDGFTFEFYGRYWKLTDQDVVVDVNLFFNSGSFPPGYNSSFIALIPKT
nr:RNA-directed DNA polymerase, eukaryota, reverse transcriptase zinc-binding domain protein [Tanacetum cinerariifolium]